MSYKLNDCSITYVDHSRLFEECKATGKPFNEWPQWVDETLRRYTLRHKYGYDDNRSIVIDPGYQVITNFF